MFSVQQSSDTKDHSTLATASLPQADGPMDQERQFRLGGDQFMIMVHAGAGTHSKEHEKNHLATCEKTCASCMTLLRNGGTALDVSEYGIKFFEDNPITNCGFGSNPNIDGEVECDATIVDHHGRSGAVGAVKGVKNPIHVARAVHDNYCLKLSLGRVPANLLIGEGALGFAMEQGISTCHPDCMLAPDALRKHKDWKAQIEKGEISETEDEASSIAVESVQGNIDPTYHPPHNVNLWNEGQPQTPRFQGSGGFGDAFNPLWLDSDITGPPAANSLMTGAKRQEDYYEGLENPITQTTGNASGDADHMLSNQKDFETAFGLGHDPFNLCADVSPPPSPESRLLPSPPNYHRLSPASQAAYVWPSYNLSEEQLFDHTYDSNEQTFVTNTAVPTHDEARKRFSDPTLHMTEEDVLFNHSCDSTDEDNITDTVGVIVVDSYGNIAAASSSGGTGLKHAGRVGPAALVNVGTAVIPPNPDDDDQVSVAVVTSGTGEHIATTMAAGLCAERFYSVTRRDKCGVVPATDEEDALQSWMQKEFTNHPSVANTQFTGAIGVLAVKKTPDAIYLHFGHTTDSFAIASMGGDDNPTTLERKLKRDKKRNAPASATRRSPRDSLKRCVRKGSGPWTFSAGRQTESPTKE